MTDLRALHEPLARDLEASPVLGPLLRRARRDAGWRAPDAASSALRDLIEERPDLAPHPGVGLLALCDGLSFGEVGQGEECATSDVVVQADLDSLLDPEPGDERVTWSELLNGELVEVAQVHHRHDALWVHADGRCFVMATHGVLLFQGRSLRDALEGLVRGRRGRPLVDPGLEAVSAWGDVFAAGAPGTYRWQR